MIRYWQLLSAAACLRGASNRYQRVKDLQLAIREWGSNDDPRIVRQVSAYSARPTLPSSQDIYGSYTQAIASYQLAVDEWADNELAHGGLAEARLAYAQRAYDGGDLALAEVQLQPLLVNDEVDSAKGLLQEISSTRLSASAGGDNFALWCILSVS